MLHNYLGGSVEVLKSFLSVSRRSRVSYELSSVPSLERWIDPIVETVSSSLTLTVNPGSCSSSSSSEKSNRVSIESSERGRDKARRKSSTGRRISADSGNNASKSIADILDSIANKLNVDSAQLLSQAEIDLENAGYYCQAYS